MSTPLAQADLCQIVARIDAIIRELEVMRRELTKSAMIPSLNLTERLFGALGHGTWEEYELHLDWLRFSS